MTISPTPPYTDSSQRGEGERGQRNRDDEGERGRWNRDNDERGANKAKRTFTMRRLIADPRIEIPHNG